MSRDILGTLFVFGGVDMYFKTALTAKLVQTSDAHYIGIGSNQYAVSKNYFDMSVELLSFLKTPHSLTEINEFVTKNNLSKKIFDELYSHKLITTNDRIFDKHDNLDFKNELFVSTMFDNSKEILNKFHDYSFVIVGCGGIGNFTSFAINTYSPQKIILVDGDKVEQSNLNRQLLFTEKEIGSYKAESLSNALKLRNPNINIEFINKFANFEILSAILKKMIASKTIIILAGDNYAALVATTKAAVQYQIPFLNIGYLNDISGIGPFYIPNISACPFCHQAFGVESDDPNDMENIQQINSKNQAPSSFVNNAFASSMGIMDIINYLSGDYAKINSLNKRVGISNQTFTKQVIQTSLDENCKYSGDQVTAN